MHVLAGILLLVVVLGAVFFLYEAHFFDSFDSLFSGVGSSYGHPGNSTSTAIANQSSYYHEVRIQFVSLGAGLNQPLVVSLSAAVPQNGGITVTSWTLKTDKGTYTIPKVVNLYSPSVAGVPPEDIYIKTGGTINFYSGKNPQGNDQAIRSALAEWQVWLGTGFTLPQHGTITLKDQGGKLVDQYDY